MAVLGEPPSGGSLSENKCLIKVPKYPDLCSFASFIIFFNIYSAAPGLPLWHAGSLIVTEARTLSCGVWRLVP